jgi:5,6-dimethylbenzimidazole synthase
LPDSSPDFSPDFSKDEQRGVYRAIHERRDVRSRFLPDPVPDPVLARVLNAAHHAPSVGFMQPWDFIVIRDAAIRRDVQRNFEQANLQASAAYADERRELYNKLKLAAILDAPVNLCITCDQQRQKGGGLGRQSIPATAVYSTVCAVQNLWLAARAEGLGAGWVSILDLENLRSVLGIPEHVIPVAYLCLGYVSEFDTRPELEQRGWESREPLENLLHFDRWGEQDQRQASALLDSLAKSTPKSTKA